MKIIQAWKHLTNTYCESHGDSVCLSVFLPFFLSFFISFFLCFFLSFFPSFFVSFFLLVAHIQPWDYMANQTPKFLLNDTLFLSVRLHLGLAIYIWHCMWVGERVGLLTVPHKGLLSSKFLLSFDASSILSSDASSIIISCVFLFVSWWDPACLSWVSTLVRLL